MNRKRVKREKDRSKIRKIKRSQTRKVFFCHLEHKPPSRFIGHQNHILKIFQNILANSNENKNYNRTNQARRARVYIRGEVLRTKSYEGGQIFPGTFTIGVTQTQTQHQFETVPARLVQALLSTCDSLPDRTSQPGHSTKGLGCTLSTMQDPSLASTFTLPIRR